ncbi:flavin reductase family protein [Celeribacter sp.]|uniref:flavin reductase family protein n=1 Tax=Celeribacter sp. TaxID=1890673 RepID=UPI003A8CF6AD
MFYRPEDGHGLPHNPFAALVSPRPIGWISTRSRDGHDNLAPYSFFNAVSHAPPQVMFASSGRKDSVANAEDTGVFCVNIVGAELAATMNASSAALAHDEDEFSHAGAIKVACEEIPCARVGNAPAALECRTSQVVPLLGGAIAVFGEVVGIHMREDCLIDGRFDVVRARMLSRLGYRDYSEIKDVFELVRPDS